MNKKKVLKLNEKGQTLLFVVVAVTIALTVGIAVSTRTISSLRRVSRTDTSSRVIAVAEGGIENLLGKTYSELDSAISPGEDNCPKIGATYVTSESSCVYEFAPIVLNENTQDLINTRAVVSVDKFNSNEIDNGYFFTLEPDSVKEVNLDGYGNSDIEICWKEPNALVYYYSYDDGGNILKGGLFNDDTSIDSAYFEGFSQDGGSNHGYEACSTVSLVGSDSYGLRVRVLYTPSVVAVFPTSGDLPDQGYKLTSRGELSSNTDSQETATVIVYKSLPYASDIFDFGIYTPNDLTSGN